MVDIDSPTLVQEPITPWSKQWNDTFDRECIKTTSFKPKSNLHNHVSTETLAFIRTLLQPMKSTGSALKINGLSDLTGDLLALTVEPKRKVRFCDPLVTKVGYACVEHYRQNVLDNMKNFHKSDPLYHKSDGLLIKNNIDERFNRPELPMVRVQKLSSNMSRHESINLHSKSQRNRSQLFMSSVPSTQLKHQDSTRLYYNKFMKEPLDRKMPGSSPTLIDSDDEIWTQDTEPKLINQNNSIHANVADVSVVTVDSIDDVWNQLRLESNSTIPSTKSEMQLTKYHISDSTFDNNLLKPLVYNTQSISSNQVQLTSSLDRNQLKLSTNQLSQCHSNIPSKAMIRKRLTRKPRFHPSTHPHLLSQPQTTTPEPTITPMLSLQLQSDTGFTMIPSSPSYSYQQVQSSVPKSNGFRKIHNVVRNYFLT